MKNPSTEAASAAVAPADEDDVVMSLLGLHSSHAAAESPPKRRKLHEEPISAQQFSQEVAENGVSQGASNVSEETEATSASARYRPQAVSPPIPGPPKFGSEIALIQIGRKRRDHPTVEGQFDDASETDVPQVTPPIAARPQASEIRTYPDSSVSHHSPPSEYSQHSLPSQLIQRPPNEHATSPVFHAQASADLARQAALAYQRRTLLAEASRFPPHFAAMMQGGHADVLLDHERRLQMEALLNFQAQMQMARMNSAGEVPGALPRPPIGVPPHLVGLMGLEAANNPLTSRASRSGSTTDEVAGALLKARNAASASVGTGNGTLDSYGLRKAVEKPAMRPPQSPPDGPTAAEAAPTSIPLKQEPKRKQTHAGTKHHTDTETESEDDNASYDSESGHPEHGSGAARAESSSLSGGSAGESGASTSGNKKSRSRVARAFSTKIRYEQYTPPVSWDELTKVPRMPPTPADDKLEHLVETVGPHDVLLGRGGLTNTNPGNIRFRALVSKYRMHYCTAPKGDKGALARYLCNYVRANKGQFLQKDPVTQRWFEVGDDKAVMKCGQALREGTAELIRKALDPDEAEATVHK